MLGPGAGRIKAERLRQVLVEGWTSEHDDSHDEGQLALAAVCYAAPEQIFIKRPGTNGVMFHDPWPFELRYDKRPYDGNVIVLPKLRSDEERVQLLVKAGALIAAEIDRLLRRSK